MNWALGVGEELDRNVGNAEQRPGTEREQEPLGAAQNRTVRRDREDCGGDGDNRALDGNHRRQG
jgi:hypothetical protein